MSLKATSDGRFAGKESLSATLSGEDKWEAAFFESAGCLG